METDKLKEEDLTAIKKQLDLFTFPLHTTTAELDKNNIVHLKNELGRDVMFMGLQEYEDILKWNNDDK